MIVVRSSAFSLFLLFRDSLRQVEAGLLVLLED
jgi:hypothetical protein